jgi:limonene-1,2-epoxide hydrolase
MGKSGEIVRDFVRAWSTVDVKRICEFFTDDAVYHNMMLPPTKGKANVEKAIQGFLSSWKDVDWEILNLVESGDLVMAERVDRGVANGKPFALPVVGVFELSGGKIRAWRDYFDMPTYVKAVSP